MLLLFHFLEVFRPCRNTKGNLRRVDWMEVAILCKLRPLSTPPLTALCLALAAVLKLRASGGKGWVITEQRCMLAPTWITQRDLPTRDKKKEAATKEQFIEIAKIDQWSQNYPGKDCFRTLPGTFVELKRNVLIITFCSQRWKRVCDPGESCPGSQLLQELRIKATAHCLATGHKKLVRLCHEHLDFFGWERLTKPPTPCPITFCCWSQANNKSAAARVEGNSHLCVKGEASFRVRYVATIPSFLVVKCQSEMEEVLTIWPEWHRLCENFWMTVSMMSPWSRFWYLSLFYAARRCCKRRQTLVGR